MPRRSAGLFRMLEWWPKLFSPKQHEEMLTSTSTTSVVSRLNPHPSLTRARGSSLADRAGFRCRFRRNRPADLLLARALCGAYQCAR